MQQCMTENCYDDRLGAALRLAGLDERRSAENVRKGLIAAVRRAVHAEVVAFLGYAEAGDDGILCTGVHRVGDRSLRALLDLEGQLTPFGADAVRRPVPSTPNRFVQLDPRPGFPRVVIGTFYAGDEVLGSVVVVPDARSNTRQLVGALNVAAPRLAAALRRAADLDDDLWRAGSTAAAVIGPGGALGESTSPATRHFARRRGERLRQRICQTIRSAGPRKFAFDGTWVQVEPLLNGGAGSAYLVTLSQVERPRLAADHALTPRQREVCALYARGMKPSSIAPRLDLTARSVQRILKQCFDRLGVSDIGALRLLLDATPAPAKKRSRPRPSALPGRAALLEKARSGLLQLSQDWV